VPAGPALASSRPPSRCPCCLFDRARCPRLSCVAASGGRQHPPAAGRVSPHCVARPPKPAQLHPPAWPQHQVNCCLCSRVFLARCSALPISRYKEWYSSTFNEDSKGSRLSGRRRQSDSQTAILLLLTLLAVAVGERNCRVAGVSVCFLFRICRAAKLYAADEGKNVSSMADVSGSERRRALRRGPFCRAECERPIRDRGPLFRDGCLPKGASAATAQHSDAAFLRGELERVQISFAARHCADANRACVCAPVVLASCDFSCWTRRTRSRRLRSFGRSSTS